MLALGAAAAALGCFVGSASAARDVVESSLSISPFGTVRIFRDGDAPKDVTVIFSGVEGWTTDLTSRAKGVVVSGAGMVVGIDLPAYLRADEFRTQRDQGNQCIDYSSDLMLLLERVADATNAPRETAPLLVSAGNGGGVAYAAAAQSQRGRVKGIIAEDFCPAIDGEVPPCTRSSGLSYSSIHDGRGVLLNPDPQFGAPFVAIADQKDCPVSDLKSFTGKMPDARVVAPVPGRALDLLISVVTQTRANIAKGPSNDSAHLAQLPLIEIPGTSSADDRLAIVLTGDGGWADIDKMIGEMLTQRGIAVVGFNTLKYFWKEKAPAQAAADIEVVTQHYLRAWKKRRVVFVGFSFGANVLPFIIPRFSSDLRKKIQMVALLAPGPHAYFEISVGGWIGEEPENGPWLAPAIKALHVPAVLCVHGEGEGKSSCPPHNVGNVDVMVLPGGHHFGGDYGPIIDSILKERGNRSPRIR